MKLKVQDEVPVKPLNWGEMVEAHLAGQPLPDPDYGQGKGKGDSAQPQGGKPEDGADGDDGQGDMVADGGDRQGEDRQDGPQADGPTDIHGQGTIGGNGGSGFNSLFAELTDSVENDLPGLTMEVGDALAAAINEACKDDVKSGEQMWRSPCPEMDTIGVVTCENAGKGKALRTAIRPQIAVIKSRLRAKFLEAKTKKVIHGVRKGAAMSERRIVDSVIDIKSGRVPQRPDFRVELKDDPSLAVSLVIDESGSMSLLCKDVRKAAVAVADALDGLGCPIQVIGPRSSSFYGDYTEGCHRYQSVHIDVFKDWNENMGKALPRFHAITADGSTPLEDGIQHALRELNKRSEAHRIVLVLTDGAPDNSAVVRRQIRIAGEAGIQVVGVALNSHCVYSVKNLFKDHILVGDGLADLGAKLVAHLEGVMFPKRAKTIKVDDPKVRLKSA